MSRGLSVSCHFGPVPSPIISEENRRYLRGINFNGRYTLYNAPIELILGEPKLLVVCFKKEKNVSQICNISM